MMMKKSGIIVWIMIALVAGVVAGCGNDEDVRDVGIDPEMTGYEDFVTGAFEGESYIIAYGSQGSTASRLQLLSCAQSIRFAMSTIPEDQMTIKADTAVTDEDVASSHLILVGNPQSNALFARINDQLPIQIKDGGILVPGLDWFDDSTSAMFIALIPNPLNQAKYLLVYGAVNTESFSELRKITMHIRREEYLIKTDARRRYGGVFSKSSSAWLIPTLVEKKTTKGFEGFESEHFLVRVDPVDQKSLDQIEAIINRREATYQEYAAMLGFEPEGPIEIDIFMTQDIKEHYVGRDDDTKSGIIYEVHDQGAEDSDYKQELAKVFLSQGGQALDQMVGDGLVFEISSQVMYAMSSHDPNLGMKDILASKSLVPLTAMSGGRIDPVLDAAIVEEELRSFYHYLIENYGLDRALDLYEANGNKRAEAAFVAVYDKPLKELEAAWIKSFEENQE